MGDIFILADLDGTLLDTATHLSAHYIETLNNLINKGLKFSIATGRDIENTKKAVPGLKFNFPAIFTNGAVLADLNSEKIIKFHKIPEDIVQNTLRITEKMNLNPMVYAYYNNKTDKIQYLKGKWSDFPLLPLKKQDYYHFAEEPCVSLQFHTKKKYLVPVYHKLLDLYEKQVQLVFMPDVAYKKKGIKEDYYWLEINSIAAGKANMMQFLSDYINIPIENFIVFGDNHNDKEMLKKAGYAIAMQDAPQEVKDIADLIISSSDTGAVISYLKERENILINSNDEFSEL